MICLVEVLSSKTFCTSNLIGRILVISIHRQKKKKKTHTRLSETNTLASTRVKCHWGTYWGVDGRRFPEVQPSMRKRTYSTGREKSAGPGSHTYIQMSLSGHNSTTGQRFVTDHGLLPHPPLTFIKNPTPMSVFFFVFSFYRKYYNYLINGSNKSTINNTNKTKTVARHEESITNRIVLRASQWGLIESAAHGTCSREAWCVQPALATKCFPELLLQCSLSLYVNELESSQ